MDELDNLLTEDFEPSLKEVIRNDPNIPTDNYIEKAIKILDDAPNPKTKEVKVVTL